MNKPLTFARLVLIVVLSQTAALVTHDILLWLRGCSEVCQ